MMAAQTAADEVMVSDCREVYEFKMSRGKPIVKNKVSITYSTLRDYGVKVQPAVFYGDNITLDASSCSGKPVPQNRSATPENVFYDDSRVCYYNVTLSRSNRECRATFERTFTDLHYFTRVLLGEQYYIKHKKVTFIIPKQMSDYRVVEKNLSPAVKVERAEKGANRIITYVINDMQALKDEDNAPAMASASPVVYVVGSFSDAHDMFAWSLALADVDTSIPTLDEILAAIEHQGQGDEDKIRNTFAWVQDNIRYVAFEAGVSKHQPDAPAQVVRKRYGDCKGMALLLKTLLVAQGFDARLTDVGTRETSCLMSEIPTLAAINHAICTLEWQGKTYYLDPTCNHIPLGHIPSNVQGVEVMVEQPGASGSLRTVPVLPITANSDSVRIDLHLNHSWQLEGSISRWFKGDMKELMLTRYDQHEAADRKQLIYNAMNDNDHANRLESVAWQDRDSRSEWAVLTATMTDGHSVEQVDRELFVELDPDNMLLSSLIDTTDRQNDYLLPFPCHQVREVVLQVPAGYRCDALPGNYIMNDEVGELSCTYQLVGDKVVYRKVMNVCNPHIKRGYITTWNSHLKQWNEHSHEQVVLSRQSSQ